MKYLLIILSLIIMSCDMEALNQAMQDMNKSDVPINGNIIVKYDTDKSMCPNNFQIIEIDSCQYIQYRVAGGYVNIVHKGNCKYCLIRNSKNLKAERENY